jgi:hypothetical protein
VLIRLRNGDKWRLLRCACANWPGQLRHALVQRKADSSSCHHGHIACFRTPDARTVHAFSFGKCGMWHGSFLTLRNVWQGATLCMHRKSTDMLPAPRAPIAFCGPSAHARCSASSASMAVFLHFLCPCLVAVCCCGSVFSSFCLGAANSRGLAASPRPHTANFRA